MAGGRLSPSGLDPAATTVIDGYVGRLARLLPVPGRRRSRILAELRDDLVDATAAQLPWVADPAAAARAAVAGFGDAETVAAAFRPELATWYARRFGLVLLATGPLVGGGWAASAFLAGGGAPWRAPLLLAVPLVLLGAPAAVLTLAVTGGRWCRTGLPAALASGTVAGAAAVLADLILLVSTGVVLLAAGASPPVLLALAATASVARLGFVLTSAAGLRRLVVRRVTVDNLSTG